MKLYTVSSLAQAHPSGSSSNGTSFAMHLSLSHATLGIHLLLIGGAIGTGLAFNCIRDKRCKI